MVVKGANNFSLEENTDFYSQQEFLIKGKENNWSSINYLPEKLYGEEKKPIIFKDTTFSRVSFKSTDIKYIKFLRCKFEECLFIGSHLINCEFIECDFRKTNTLKIKIEKCLLDPNQFKNNFNFIVDANIAVDLYQELYKNSKLEEQVEYANESLYKMKLASSYNLNYKLNARKISKSKFWHEKIKDLLYRHLMGYGLKIGKIFVSFLVFILFMSILNFTFHDGFNRNISGFIDSIYFTVVTVTTLGYGDIVPITDLSKIFIIIESIAGFVYMSLFVGAFINRVLRS